MIKMKLFRHTFFLLVVVGALDLIANFFYLYWTSNWFDKGVHFLAGVVVAMASSVLLFIYYKKVVPSFSVLMKVAIISTVFVGFLWEVYELYFEIEYFTENDYFLDTSLDMIMDLLGAIVGGFYSHRTLAKEYIKNAR